MSGKCVSTGALALFFLLGSASCKQIAGNLLPTGRLLSQEVSNPSDPIPGWENFVGDRIELWLPGSYRGGNLENDLDLILEDLKQLGPEYQQIARAVEQNPSLFSIWAFDSDSVSSGFLTNVTVTNERVLSAMTLDAYMDAGVRQLPAQFQVVDRKLISLDRYQAGRLTVEFTLNGVSGKQMMYVIKSGNTMWNITYSTGRDEFERRLPNFERSANSFWVRR